MSNRLALRRRSFLGSVVALSGGFTLGWHVPAFAQRNGQELGIWVVISPDDTTVVRIARSEMGQGTFTGLAQLVADELDCAWKHVRAECVSPDENLAHKRAWATCRPAAAAAFAARWITCARAAPRLAPC